MGRWRAQRQAWQRAGRLRSAAGFGPSAPGAALPCPPLLQFNIVPWHCLVVTAEFRSQAEELDAGDLEATWAVMQVSREEQG